MNVKSIEKEGSKAKVVVEVEAELLESGKQKAYLKARKNIMVPGFRKGKCPRQMIEAMYGADVFTEDGINEIFPEVYAGTVLKEENLKPVGMPTVVDMQFPEAGGVELTVETELYPEVTLGDYKGLEIPKAEATVSDDEIAAELNRMAENVARVTTVERAAKDGDIAVIDFEGFDNGVSFDGGKGEDYELELGSHSFVPGFEEQVAGIRAGEERDVHVTFPQQYTPELAGKDATFHVKAHEINRRTAPELSDETARRFGFENLAALRRAILEGAVRQKEAACRESFSDRLIAMVIAGMETEIPEVMVEGQLDGLMQELEQRLHQQGASLDDYLKAAGTTREALRDHAREQARHGVQVELALSEVARRENIHITDEELEQEYAQLSKEYQVPMERLREGLPPQRLTHDLRLARARAVIVDSAKALPGQPKN